MKTSRIVFILFLFIWFAVLNALILGNFDKGMKFNNFITGNVIAAGSYNEVYSPLIIFNILIAVLFTTSYYSWETQKWKRAKQH